LIVIELDVAGSPEEHLLIEEVVQAVGVLVGGHIDHAEPHRCIVVRAAGDAEMEDLAVLR
jgi:hypothetical protein